MESNFAMDANDILAVNAGLHGEQRHRNAGRSSSARSRNQSSGKSGTTLNTDNASEDAPLLGDTGRLRRQSAVSAAGSEPPVWFGTAEIQHLPWWKRPSIWWMIPNFLLFTLAFGGIVVPKLNLIVDLICNDYWEEQAINDPSGLVPPIDGDRCRNDAISARTALFILYGGLATGILSAFTGPMLGAASDRYGRKPVMVLTAFGALGGEVLTILAAKYPDTVDVNWILLGYAIDGICGSMVLGMAIAQSYATDCTPPQKRNVAFGYFHACLFGGIAIGPVAAGYIIKKTGSVLMVFYIALGCHVVFMLFILFIVPESLSKSRQETARERHRMEMEAMGPAGDWINQLRSISPFAPLKVLYPTGPGSSSGVRRNLLLLAATDMIMFSIAMGSMGVVILYVRQQFGWKDWESGKYVSIVSACRVFCLLVLLPLVTRLIRGKQGTSKQRNSGSDTFDLAVIRVAILFDMLGYLGYTLVRQGDLFIASGAIASIGGIGSPALGSALTKHVPPDRVGQLLGATGLLHAISRVIGPTIFNGIYSATVANYRQTVFVCLTATFALAFLSSWFVKPHVYLEDLELDGSPSRRPSTLEEEAS
ncbi:MFS general substrate transporter [Amniculicola lignicola CBS 123094]|uniref:MFS general substrate transporter n=1 Tax=Amniculicola lignicola CBS 123094 TaxID=1392246 RepID=A0A6A5WHH2_9PLEO|nr:MFS general substrate transporter [Amniculicola lignicola CBS 123094]